MAPFGCMSPAERNYTGYCWLGALWVKLQTSSLLFVSGVNSSGASESRTSLSTNDNFRGAPGGAWMSQDCPLDPCAEGSSFSLCICRAHCRLTLGLGPRFGVDHTNQSLLLPPANQHTVGLCAVISHLPS